MYPTWIKCVVGLVLAAFLAVGIGTWVSALPAEGCFVGPTSTSSSPDKIYEALLFEKTCTFGPFGGTYHIVSLRSIGSADEGTEIFSADLSAPALLWLEAHRLMVTINDVSWVGVSLHRVDGIEVSYQLADRLSEADVSERERVWEERSLANIHPAPPGQSNEALKSFYLAKAAQKERFEKFKAWARANIPGAYSR